MKRSAKGRHTINQKAHAQVRAKERLGFTLTPRELKALAQRVRCGVFLRQGMAGREVWRVQVRGRECDVVFDPERGHVVSFLPLRTVTDVPARKEPTNP